MSNIIVIILFLIILVYGLFISKVNCYKLFIDGCKDGLNTTVNIFPYIITFCLVVTVMKSSGILEYVFNLGIKYVGLILQMIIRPLSGSSSLAMMIDNYVNYGVDSKISIFSTGINYACEGALFIIPFYYSYLNIEKYNKILILGIIINIISYFIVIVISLLFL